MGEGEGGNSGIEKEGCETRAARIAALPTPSLFLRSIDKLTKLGISHKGFSLDPPIIKKIRRDRSMKILVLLMLLLMLISAVAATPSWRLSSSQTAAAHPAASRRGMRGAAA